MGMRRAKVSISPGTQDILNILQNAEKLFWSDLTLVAKRGNVFHVRDTAVSLALIRAFQDTLGKARPEGPTLAACLLGTYLSQSAYLLLTEMNRQIQCDYSAPRGPRGRTVQV